MTVERVAVLENEVEHLKADLAEMKAQLEAANRKLDDLVAAANMGKGAWWASVKIGGLIIGVMGAAAWLIEGAKGLFR